MTPRRFEWTLRARGPRLADWPETDRFAALALLRRSRAARLALADALADEDAPAPDPATLHRMQGTLRRRMTPVPVMAHPMRWGALAACAAAGLYLGIGTTDLDPPQDVFAGMQTTVIAALDP